MNSPTRSPAGDAQRATSTAVRAIGATYAASEAARGRRSTSPPAPKGGGKRGGNGGGNGGGNETVNSRITINTAGPDITLATDGKLGGVLATATDVMLDVAFDPAGKRLVAGGSDGQVRLINLASRKVTHTLGLHSDWVNAVTWDHNGSRFATASRDHTAKVYDVTANKSLVTFAGHGKNVRGVTFHPDGNEVFTSGMDKKVQRWRISDGKRVRDIGFGAELFKLARHENFI